MARTKDKSTEAVQFFLVGIILSAAGFLFENNLTPSKPKPSNDNVAGAGTGVVEFTMDAPATKSMPSDFDSLSNCS